MITDIIVVIAAIILTSCNNQSVVSISQALITSEKLWKDQELSNYDFILERQAFAPEDWR
jgi:hypothetical protein